MEKPIRKLVEEKVLQQSKIAAKAFGGDPQSVYGAVCEKVLENWAKLAAPPDNPVAWIDTTARFEARRCFLREKTLMRKEKGLLKHSFDESQEGTFVLRGSPADVLDQWIRQEEEESRHRLYGSVRAAAERLPRDQWEALLVTAGARECDPAATELPQTVSALANSRECSRQHIYDLAQRAAAALRKGNGQGGCGAY